MHIFLDKQKAIVWKPRVWFKRKLYHVIPMIFIALCAQTAWAQSDDALFPDQRLVYSKALKERIYFLTLEPLEKINGKWVSEREEAVRTRVEGRTYEISHPYDLKSAWLSVQQHYTSIGADLVYECLGLECGSSNAWANERFEVPLLYGLDLSQRYQVWQWLEDSQPQIAVVYLIQRGNQRIFFHVDRLQPSDNSLRITPGASVIAKQFYSKGYVTVPGLQFSNGKLSADHRSIEALAKALNEKPFHLLSIVGIDDFPGSKEEQQQRSLAYAREVMSLLIRKGVRARRMETKGDGAPEFLAAGDNAAVLVEIRKK